MESLGLQVLAEACKTCDESYNSDADNKENIDTHMKSVSNFHPILYCKARGTPLDHQQEKAILQFSSGEEYTHGAELTCSHLVCRQNGVKFRYCAYCEKAVAKRNFRKRHSHTDEISYCTKIVNNAMHCQETNKNQWNPSNNKSNIPMQSLHPGKPQQLQQPQPLKQIEQIEPLQTWNINNVKCENHDIDNLRKENNFEKRNIKSFEYNEYNPQKLKDSSSIQSTGNGVPKEWIDLYKKKPNINSTSKETNDWLSEVKRIAMIKSNPMINETELENKKAFFDYTGANSTTSSNINSFSFEEMSSSSIRYYDKIVNEVKEEFKGIAPPRSQTTLSANDIAKYRQDAEPTMLQVNTDIETIGSNSTIMIDSKGSIILTPKYF